MALVKGGRLFWSLTEGAESKMSWSALFTEDTYNNTDGSVISYADNSGKACTGTSPDTAH